MEQNTRYAARPLTLGRNGRTPKTLRNRLASAPMERNYGTTDGRITEQYIDYLVTRAKAGLGMVTTEATYVRADGKGRTPQAAVSGFKNVAPSPVPCEVAGGEIPRELTSDECEGLVDAYAQAARRAVQAGFDVINLHGAHGYLIH